MKVWFDMDGTITDLYGVEGWLDMLQAENTTPYEIAKPLCRMSTLAYYLHKLQKNGYEIGIISWTSKEGTNSYNAAVEAAKRAWLAQHLPSVNWDYIYIVPYGTNKYQLCHQPHSILFDDEARNREPWGTNGCQPEQIFSVCRGLLH